MRVSGKGASSDFGSTSGQGGNRGNAFRRRHRTGERLSGRILRREAPGLAWVDFQGLELLATIQSDPDPGVTLLFQIICLEPDIRLQELRVARAAGDPLGPAVDAFWAARSQFESRCETLRTTLGGMPGSPAARKTAFCEALLQNAELASGFTALNAARKVVCAYTLARGTGRLEYRPWLLPEALSMEMLVRSSLDTGSATGLTETALSCNLPGAGQCELRFVQRPPRVSARLLVEHTEAAAAAMEILTRSGFPAPSVQLFDPAPLSPAFRAGVLAPLLACGPGARPRFSRQV